MSQLLIGIDTGGTFTDFVMFDKKHGLRRWKVLSTPSDPSLAILQGLNDLLGELSQYKIEIIHGTTVGTNAFLERKGAKTCLFTTKGFEDVLFIGRQARPALYDLYAQKPKDIIPRNMVVGVEERCNAQGEILKKIDESELNRCADFVKENRIDTVAICFLHSYMNRENEKRLGRFFEDKGVKVCISSELLPEFREFERTSTTVINAYLGPVVGNYIRSLKQRLPKTSILVQLSSGGCLPADKVEDMAVSTILSGPAGGVLAGLELGKSLGISNILTFDMGGTSTDVSLCPGRLVYTREYKLEGFPINLPVIDVHTVGAGGGSIAWIDKGGLLKVGPRSAGADPGPVCYGKGNEITVTDANLFLGRLMSDKFLGGRMTLNLDRVQERMCDLSKSLGLSPEETALGIIKLVNINMVQALRQVSIERGYDPRDFHLVSFGGAAGLHALSVADELEVKRVIIPEMAGVFSAQGLAASDLLFEGSKGLFWQSDKEDPKVIKETAQKIEEDLLAQAAPFMDANIKIQKNIHLDVRYLGQSFEIMIPFDEKWQETFHREHKRLYGYSMPEAVVEITAIRVKIRLIKGKKEVFFKSIPIETIYSFKKDGAASYTSSSSKIVFESGVKEVPVVDKKDIPEGKLLSGPFIITDDFTTVLIVEGWQVARCSGHLVAIKD